MELEERSVSEGAERFRRRLEQATKSGAGSTVGAAKGFLYSGLTELEDAILAFLQSRKKGPTSAAQKWISHFGTDVSSFLTLKTVLDRTSHGGSAPLGPLAAKLAQLLLDEFYYRRLKAEAPELFNSTLSGASSTSHKAHRLKASAKLAGIASDDLDISVSHRLLIGTTLINLLLTSSGWFQAGHVSRAGKKHFKLAIRLTDDAHKALAEENTLLEALAEPVVSPMLVPPLPWRRGELGGFRFALRNRFRLIRGASREQEKRHERRIAHVEMPEVYEAVNRLQSVAYKIDTRLLTVVQEIIELGGGIAGLPRTEDDPLPEKPEPESEEALKQWLKETHRAKSKNILRAAEAAKVSRTLGVAESLKDETAIWFPHNLDFRSRVYAIVSYLGPQGDDLQRSLLIFAQGKPVDATGREWLEATGANLMGEHEGQKMSRLTWEERIRWVRNNQHLIVEAAADPVGSFFWQRAEKPLSFLAFCFEYADMLAAEERGETFSSSLLCHQDGSNNGLQHYSALGLDPIGARPVNMLPSSERPEDLYSEVAASVLRKLHVDAETGDPIANLWLSLHETTGIVGRKLCKRPCMTFAYGSGRYGFSEQTKAYLKSLDNWPEIKAHFVLADEEGVVRGKLGAACSLLARLIWEALQEDVAVSAHSIMAWFQRCAKQIATENKAVHWTTPVGFPCRQEYREKKNGHIETVLHGHIISPRYQRDTPKVDRRKQAQGFPPNAVHSLDAAHLIRTVNALAAEGVTSVSTVHDSFSCCAADSTTLARVLRQQFVRLYTERNILADLHEQLASQWSDPRACPDPPQQGSLDLSGVLSSPFFFS